MERIGICIFILCIGVILCYQLFQKYGNSRLVSGMDPVNSFLKKNYSEYHGMWEPIKRVECRDGFSISIQAGFYTYSTPRRDKAWPYTEVELGFPSELDHLIDIYAEDPGTTKTVYGYVPIKVVNKLIKKHGGIIN